MLLSFSSDAVVQHEQMFLLNHLVAAQEAHTAIMVKMLSKSDIEEKENLQLYEDMRKQALIDISNRLFAEYGHIDFKKEFGLESEGSGV